MFAILAAVLALAAVAVVLVTPGGDDKDDAGEASETLQCVTEDAATGATPVSAGAPPGVFVAPREFATIAEAENFLCIRVPHPRELDGWTRQYVIASRPRPLGEYAPADGIGNRRLMIGYRSEAQGGGMEITIHSPEGSNPAIEDLREVELGSRVVGLAVMDGNFCYYWEEAGFAITACGGGDLTAEDAASLLESIE